MAPTAPGVAGVTPAGGPAGRSDRPEEQHRSHAYDRCRNRSTQHALLESPDVEGADQKADDEDPPRAHTVVRNK